ncbi:MAG: magnesium transporter, partial [Methylobacteriaceae bacterium]|nr:magnesium transporter [Methylobacteriaceae bacterium]
MLKLEGLAHAGEVPADLSANKLSPNVGWIDLFNPSPEEIAYIERAAGLKVPGRDKLVEIENSSRLHIEDGALYLSMPTIFRHGDMVGRTPLGFLLTPKIVVTVRFEELKAFADVRQRLADKDRDCAGATGIFVTILEAIVDRTADVLEHVETRLDE